MPNNTDLLKDIFQEIASINFKDGLMFDPGSVSAEEIVEQNEYHGIRIKLYAKFGTAKQQMQIDVGFGDVIYPGSLMMDYPTLLDLEAPHLKVYSLESAVAEKFEAIVSLGIATSRMKDFYDLHFFASSKEFDLLTLHNALKETFNNRQTQIEKYHFIFDDKFMSDEKLKTLWSAFIKKRLLKTDLNFSETVAKIKIFIEPPCREAYLTKKWDYKEWKWT